VTPCCLDTQVKTARQAIDEASDVISAYEQEMHGAELVHTRQTRLKAKQKKERPESPVHEHDSQEFRPEDSVKDAHTQAVARRAHARQTYQALATGAVEDLHEAIERQCVELPTAFQLKGLAHMALRQYPEAVASLTKALSGVHAPLPESESADNQQQALAEDALGHVPAIPEASIQLFLCRAAAYRGLGQLPSAIADVRHVISRYPIQHDSSAVAALESEYLEAWEAEQAAYAVDDSALLRAFDVEAASGLARRPEVLDVHAEALAAANAKKKAGSTKPATTASRVPPAERFRLECEAHREALRAESARARAPFEELGARSRAFLTRARDFKREIRANLQMEREEAQQRHVEREIAREVERRRLEQQREVDERLVMKYEDEWMRWFAGEELRLENERQRRVDEAQKRADAKVAYAARLTKRGGKRQAAVGQRGRGNSRR
jgi:tetratricopeptide (TPR) repeat protein